MKSHGKRIEAIESVVTPPPPRRVSLIVDYRKLGTPEQRETTVRELAEAEAQGHQVILLVPLE